MSIIAGATAAHAASSSSVASSDHNSSSLMNAKRVFYMRMHYRTKCSSDDNGYDGELLIEVADGEKDGLFGKKKVTKLVPLPEGVKQRLPDGAQILNVIIDWYAERVRVYYTL